MATPSLALIPCGYRASKVYSVLPTDGTGDFNFTRSGNATRVNSEGLIELVTSNVPRLNYPLLDGVVSGCPSFLLEPARTNLITYSEDFSNAYWTKSGSSVVSGFVSPKGDLSAFKLVEDTSTATHSMFKMLSGVSGTSNVISVFLKQGERRYASIVTSDTTNWNTMVVVDLQDGLITKEYNKSGFTSLNKIEKFADGWYRLSTSISGAFLGSTLYARFCAQNSATPSNPPSNSYTGDGTSGLYIWGAMLEQGSIPTSYITTQGATATRVAESCNGAGNSQIFNDSEGVLYAEFKNEDVSNYKVISISDGTANNRIFIGTRLTTGYIYYFVVSGGATQVSYITTQLASDFTKVAAKYKANDFALWINGTEVSTDSSGSTPIGLDSLQFNGGSGTLDFHGKTKQIQYFDTVLTDLQLQQLTTL